MGVGFGLVSQHTAAASLIAGSLRFGLSAGNEHCSAGADAVSAFHSQGEIWEVGGEAGALPARMEQGAESRRGQPLVYSFPMGAVRHPSEQRGSSALWGALRTKLGAGRCAA